jgi:hypothetical protein
MAGRTGRNLDNRSALELEFAMKRRLAAPIAHMLFFTQFGNVWAAGAFDGEWSGSATSTVGRCKPATVTLAVRGREVTGRARFEIDTQNINGTVWEDGTFGATIGWQPLTGNFIDDRFEATFESGNCVWKMVVKRTK